MIKQSHAQLSAESQKDRIELKSSCPITKFVWFCAINIGLWLIFVMCSKSMEIQMAKRKRNFAAISSNSHLVRNEKGIDYSFKFLCTKWENKQK